MEDEELREIRQLIKENKTSNFTKDGNGTLWSGKRLCVPNLKPFRGVILWEARDSAYSIHPDSTKMYKDLKTRYWWYMPASQGGTPEASRVVIVIEGPRLEMGRNHNGLHS
jgi:hypothetical protein